MNKHDIAQQLQSGDPQAVVSMASAGSGWLVWVSGANEILITVATCVAITSGAWSLWDKWKLRGGADDKTDSSEQD